MVRATPRAVRSNTARASSRNRPATTGPTSIPASATARPRHCFAISSRRGVRIRIWRGYEAGGAGPLPHPAFQRQYTEWEAGRSEKHTSELQSLMRISYAVFCLKKKNKNTQPAEETKDNKSVK